MKLYHGTQQRFKRGDILEAFRDESHVMRNVYATSYINLAVQYTIHPIHHDWAKKGVVYLPFIDTMLVQNYHTDNYVYEVDPTGFSFLFKYDDDNGDEWINPANVKIVNSIEITPEVLSDSGYNVRIIKGNKFTKKIVFRLAKTRMVANLFLKNKPLFEKLTNLFTEKYQSEKDK